MRIESLEVDLLSDALFTLENLMVRREWSVALTLLLCALMGLPAADGAGSPPLPYPLLQ